jgi:hypothetical protein
MTLASSGELPGVIWVESEFQIPGKYATCGPNALAMAECYGVQKYLGGAAPAYNPTATTVMYNRMFKAGRCASNGSSKMRVGLMAQAKADGFTAVGIPSIGNWKSFAIMRLTDGAPVLYEPSNGQVLRDLITGLGMDATGLRYHFNLLVGYFPGGFNTKANKELPEGFWACDGDSDATNPIVNGKRQRVVAGHSLQYYSVANLADSHPYDMVAVYPRVQIGPPPLVGPPPGFPAGWTDDGATLMSPDHRPIVKGFRDYCLAHPALFNGLFIYNTPLAPEQVVSQVEAWNPTHGAGSIQTFHNMRLCWTPKDGVYMMWIGDELVYYEQKAGV